MATKHYKKITIIVSTFFFLLFFLNYTAIAASWTSGGPSGGYINSLAMARTNPDIIYAGTARGVFKTVDGGALWTKTEFPETIVRVVKVAPDNSAIVYAGTDDGIYKSEDGGDTWAQQNGQSDELSGARVNAIAINPLNPCILYAGTGKPLTAGIGTIFKSTDGGQTWHEKYSEGIDAVAALLIDTDDSSYIYAGVWSRYSDPGFLKSTDEGENWVRRQVGPSSREHVVALAMTSAPSAPVIYAIVEGDDVYKSIDRGETWESTGTPGIHGTWPPWALAVDPNHPNIIYVGSQSYVYKSADGADTWFVKVNGLPPGARYPSSIVIDPRNSAVLHVGLSQGGLYKSTDWAERWSSSSQGLNNSYIRDLSVHPNSSNTVLAARSGAVHYLAKTTDGGTSWYDLIGINSPMNIGTVTIDPQHPSTIWAGDPYKYSKHFYIYKSTDGGQSWEDRIELLHCIGYCQAGVSDILINLNNSDNILVGITGHYGILSRTTDGGLTWQHLPISSSALAADPNNPNIVYSGKTEIGQVYRTTDFGAQDTWAEITPAGGIGDVRDIEVDSDSKVYVAASDGLWRWDGSDWTELTGLPTDDITALAIDRSTSPGTVYVGTGEDGMFVSQDGGSTWIPFNEGLGNLSIRELAISASQPIMLYAGTAYGGVWSEMIGEATPDIFEHGHTTLDHDWTSITLDNTYQNPVVIIGPPTYHGTDPGVVRLSNVTNNSFDIRFQEWLYKDGSHTQENIPYLALSSDRHQVPDGSIWEAGTFSLSGTGAWTVHAFTDTFPFTPALFLTTQTYNGSDPITVRARDVTNTGFEAALFEEENKMDGHVTEVVGYLAVYSPQLSGTVNINGTDVPYLLQAQSVDHRFVPVLSSDIKLEEEKSKDSEVNHIDETVSILALGDKIFTQDISSSGGDTIAIRRLAPEYNAAMEWGTVDGVDQNWMKVPLAKEYMNPVVVARPVSSDGGDPGVIRIRNVSYNSFELRYNEWAYKDGWHIQERVFYMVVEAGEQSVAGLTVEAGRLDSSKLLADGWEPISFSAFFGQTPSVFTSVQTYNGADPVTTRVKSCTSAGFDLTMDEEEAKNDGHTTENIGWIAIKKGTGNTNDNRSVKVFGGSTTHIPTQINFGQSMARRFPVVVSDMITTNGGDPCFLRYQDLGPNSIDLFIQEEASSDAEMGHAMEDVSVFVGE